MRPSAANTLRTLNQLASAITPRLEGCVCEVRTEPILQLRVNVGALKLSVAEDDQAAGRFVLVDVTPDGDFLAGYLAPVEVVAKVVSLLKRGDGMDEHFKVCGNCGHCTRLDGQFVCLDPAKPQQEIVPMGARRACFVVTPLTPEQLKASALWPAESAAIN